MAGLQKSDPPVQIGIGAQARIQTTTPLKHNSPLPRDASSAPSGTTAPAPHTLSSISQYPDGRADGGVTAVKVGVGEDPLSSNLFPRKPPVPPTPQQPRVAPPAAITPIQSTVTPPPKPPRVEKDPVVDMTTKFLSTVRKRPINTTKVTQNIESLRALCHASAWRAAVELSEFVLHANSLDGTEDCITVSMKNMSGYFGDKNTDTGPLNEAAKLRFEGLFRTKCFEDLTQEASDVLHIEEKRQGSTGGLTDIIIAMRLILAEVKACTRKGEEATRDLAVLVDEIVKCEERGRGGAGVAFSESWRWRGKWALCSTTLRGGQTSVSTKMLLQYHEELDDLKRRYAGTDGNALAALRVEEAQVVVLCRLSRTLLQAGALKAGIGYCDMIVARVSEVTARYQSAEGSAPIIARMTAQMNFTRALALFGISNFEEAMSLFEAIIQTEAEAEGDGGEKSVPGERNEEYPTLLESLVHSEESLVSMSVNNYSVCALYTKRVRESIDSLERLIQRDPARYMIDPVVFNLCTLYDLSCGPEMSGRKKLAMQRVAAQYNIHEPLLNVKSFRLT